MTELDQKKGIEISSVLRFFFGISSDQIREDLADPVLVDENLRITRSESSPCSLDNAEAWGEFFHHRLLRSVKMVQDSRLPSDLVLFAVTLTAHEIAELSCSDSCGRGRASLLCKILEPLEKSGELGEVTDDILDSESLVRRIHDTVFLEILSRYGLSKIALLFENNRPLYEIRCVVGRQLILGEPIDAEEHAGNVEKFRKAYGSEFVREYVRRLNSHDLLLG